MLHGVGPTRSGMMWKKCSLKNVDGVGPSVVGPRCEMVVLDQHLVV